MSNQNDISYLTSEDLEMLLLGTVAFWGDGSLNKEELDLLNQGCRKRIENLQITALSDSNDIELSSKEYIIALFKMIEKVSGDSKIYEDTELHKDFIKKKGKDYQPDDQLKFFSFLINELNASYEDDLNPEIEVAEIPKEQLEKLFDELKKESIEKFNVRREKEDFLKAVNDFPEVFKSCINIEYEYKDNLRMVFFTRVINLYVASDIRNMPFKFDFLKTKSYRKMSPDAFLNLLKEHYDENPKDFSKKLLKSFMSEGEIESLKKLDKEKEGDSAGLRFTKLSNEMKKIVDIDKETDKEKDMMQLLDLYRKKDSIAGGCGCLVIIVLAAVWYFW